MSGSVVSCTKTTTDKDSLITLSSPELSKKGDRLKTKYRTATLPMSGLQEVPSNPSPATGEFTVVYNTRTKILELDMTWQGLLSDATASHIHGPAAPGVNGGVVIPLLGVPPGTTSSSFSADLLTTNFASFVEADLLNGLYYINIHTPSYPGGEIRGQILFE
ncbi:hypothetical protein HY58_07155 [Flavihumibacter sp. ZG627]|nr:hypothetical protein HY58_07155 [Flavihumibacter sp. ZG627]